MLADRLSSDAPPNDLRTSATKRSTRAFKSRLLLFAFLLTLAAPLTAEAYTLVLRSGRRVEISDRFDVTKDALVHEAAPGLRVSVRLELIDIEATERANNEPAGTFLARIADAPESAQAEPGATRGPRVVTNKDLELFRRERLRNEAEYERTRAERGLPSMEELRRRDEERDRRFIEEARRIEAEQRAAETEALRGEVQSLRTQLGLVYAQQSQGSYAPSVVYYPELFAAFPQTFQRRGFGRHAAFPRTRFAGQTFGLPPAFWPHGAFAQRPAGRASLFFRFGTPPARRHSTHGPARGGRSRR